MDNIRFALLCAAAAVCFFLYQAWQTDYANQPTAQVAQQSGQPANTGAPVNAGGGDVPSIGAPSSQGSSTSSDGSGGNAPAGGV